MTNEKNRQWRIANKALRLFLQGCPARGLKFDPKREKLLDLMMGVDFWTDFFPENFVTHPPNAISLAKGRVRADLVEHLAEMENALRDYSEELSLMADEVRDDKILLASIPQKMS